jgi:hypothetical protein
MTIIIGGTNPAVTFPDSTVQNSAVQNISGGVVQVASGGTGRSTALARCSAILTSSSSNFGENTFTKCSFNSASFDNYSGFGSGQYTIPTTGVYTITTTIYQRQQSGGLPNQYIIRIYKNGTAITNQQAEIDGASAYFYGMAQTTAWNGSLTSGDIIAIYGYHSTGNGANQCVFVQNSCTLDIQQLS